MKADYTRVKECSVIPQLANSDHLGLRVVLHGHAIMQHVHHKRRSIWRYAHADFDMACELLDELDLESIIDDFSIENSWSKWKLSCYGKMYSKSPSDLLSSIDTTKSSGPDGISGRMLKSTASSITPSITKLFNLSIKIGKLPAEWKLARVNPILKHGSKSDPSNYRPISLLSIISKLLEKHVQKCLLKHLQEHSPISDNQWGFSKGKSTTGALLTAVDN